MNIAASNRLNPASFSLSVFNEETGKFRDYKANQRIGTLCVRKEDNSFKPVTVQLNPKKSETRKSSGNLKGATPFEVRSSCQLTRIVNTLREIERKICHWRMYKRMLPSYCPQTHTRLAFLSAFFCVV